MTWAPPEESKLHKPALRSADAACNRIARWTSFGQEDV